MRGCLALEGSVGLSNSVSRWVQVMVLSRPGPAQRAQVLDKFIHVAQVRPVLLFCLLSGRSPTPSLKLCIPGGDVTMAWPRRVHHALPCPCSVDLSPVVLQGGQDGPSSLALISPRRTRPGPTLWSWTRQLTTFLLAQSPKP